MIYNSNFLYSNNFYLGLKFIESMCFGIDKTDHLIDVLKDDVNIICTTTSGNKYAISTRKTFEEMTSYTISEGNVDGAANAILQRWMWVNDKG